MAAAPVPIPDFENDFAEIAKDPAWKAILEEGRRSFAERWKNKNSAMHKTVSDFDRMKTLGAGSFGRVLLVKGKEKGDYAAMKILDKEKIVKMKQVEHTMNEKQVLYSIKFPFCVSMLAHFQVIGIAFMFLFDTISNITLLAQLVLYRNSKEILQWLTWRISVRILESRKICDWNLLIFRTYGLFIPEYDWLTDWTRFLRVGVGRFSK